MRIFISNFIKHPGMLTPQIAGQIFSC